MTIDILADKLAGRPTDRKQIEDIIRKYPNNSVKSNNRLVKELEETFLGSVAKVFRGVGNEKSQKI